MSALTANSGTGIDVDVGDAEMEYTVIKMNRSVNRVIINIVRNYKLWKMYDYFIDIATKRKSNIISKFFCK
jgi:hypothetical protein